MKNRKPAMSLSETARRLGVTRQALAIHSKNTGAPALGDIEGWTHFLAAHSRENSASAPPEIRKLIAEQRLRLLTAMADREEIRRAEDKETTVPKDSVKTVMAKGVSTLFSVLERKFSIELPAGIVGLEAGPIQTKLLTTLQEAKHEFILQCHEFLGDEK